MLIMSERYQIRPSKLVGITDSFLAFQFDETCLVLEGKCTDKDGRINYDRLLTKSGKNEFLDFAKKFGKQIEG